MAVTFLETKKRDKRLILILGIIISLIFVVILYGYFLKPEMSALPVDSFPEVTMNFKKIEINWEILKNPKLEEFEPFQEMPGITEKIGRDNPFLPVGSAPSSI